MRVRPSRPSLRSIVYRGGLYALSVVPRAPNFCALRRVSSNFERAYVSTSWPVSIRSKPCLSRSLAYAASSSAPAIQPVQRSMSRRPWALTGAGLRADRGVRLPDLVLEQLDVDLDVDGHHASLGSVAEHGSALADPLPERRRSGKTSVGHEALLVQLAGAEADRTDEELAASCRVLLEESRERRAAVAGDGFGIARKPEPDRLLRQEHCHLLALLQGRTADKERNGHAFRILEPGGEVDYDFFLVRHERPSDLVCVCGDAVPDLVVRPLHLGVISVQVVASQPEELEMVRGLEVVAARTVDRQHLSSYRRVG